MRARWLSDAHGLGVAIAEDPAVAPLAHVRPALPGSLAARMTLAKILDPHALSAGVESDETHAAEVGEVTRIKPPQRGVGAVAAAARLPDCPAS